MARYIDAELLEKSVLKPSMFDINREDVLALIAEIPTADVVPRSNEGAECPICHGTGRIGTSDWLTKRISKEQLAKEKAEAVAEYDRQLKAEVAREIFEEIQKSIVRRMKPDVALIDDRLITDIAELEKKYTEGNDVH